MRSYPEFNRAKARIFRIVHRENVPWILDHGLQCAGSPHQSPTYVTIGDPDLINKRMSCAVPIIPGGTLGDYVSFYFTPRSPMLHKILTGRGVRRFRPQEIVIIGTSLHRVAAAGGTSVFTDGHAYGRTSRFFSDLSDLDAIDWEIIRRSDFRADPEDPGKVSRYQAEALVHGGLRLDRLGALVCYDGDLADVVRRWVTSRELEIDVFVRDAWFPL